MTTLPLFSLASLAHIPGVRSFALVGQDGLALEAYGEEGEFLAAELASLRPLVERMSRRLGGGALTRLAFTSERFEVFVVTVGNFTAGVSVLRGNDSRLAQQELARLATDYEQRF